MLRFVVKGALFLIGAALLHHSIGKGSTRQSSEANKHPTEVGANGRAPNDPRAPKKMFSGHTGRYQAAEERDPGGDTPAERSMARSTKAIAQLTAALVLVGLISAGVSAAQWWEIHSGSADTHALAQAAVDQAKAAADNAKTAKEAMLSSERAWVGAIDAATPKGAIGSVIKGTVSYINSGKQPAKFMGLAKETSFARDEWDNGVAITQMIADQDQCLKTRVIFGYRFAWPTSGFSNYFLNLPNGQIPQSGVLTWTDDILSGRRYLVISGCMTYETFSQIHNTSFCYFFDSKLSDPAHLNICAAGNAVN